MVKVVYYDLETTNLRPLSGPNAIEIVQIGAVCKHQSKALKRLMGKIVEYQGRRKVIKFEGACSNTRLLDETEFTPNSGKIWGAAAPPPAPPVPPALIKQILDQSFIYILKGLVNMFQL